MSCIICLWSEEGVRNIVLGCESSLENIWGEAVVYTGHTLVGYGAI